MSEHGPAAGPVTRRRPGRVDLLALHRAHPERYPHLLESVAAGTPQGRHDILFAFPRERLTAGGSEPFLTRLDAAWQAERSAVATEAAHLPFHGGWFFYLSYELAGEIEPVLDQPAAPEGLPVACAERIPAALIYDHAADATWLVAEAGETQVLDRIEADIASMAPDAAEPAQLLSGPLREDDPQRYLEMVVTAREYILAGDVFQANLSRAWRGPLAEGVTAADLYARLRRANPAPFAGLATFDGRAVISSSPERLVSWFDGWADTRPIAGTRPRTAGTDEAMLAELIGHPKERAEHVMLIDLERNDLGRIAEPGSVEVSELMVLETYAHVHHIVSNVRARPRAGVTPGELLGAVFPGGTITGCPKVRCMEIIAELEGEGRGAYTGALGYLGRDGRMDSNILIRTLVQSDGEVSFRAGAGIVYDSIPENELEETRAKARGLVLALEQD